MIRSSWPGLRPSLDTSELRLECPPSNMFAHLDERVFDAPGERDVLEWRKPGTRRAPTPPKTYKPFSKT